MTNPIEKIKIYCDNCGKLIAVAILCPEGESKDNPRPILKVLGESGWICNTTLYYFNRTELTKESLFKITELLKQKKFKELRQIDYDDVFGFFCFKCDKNYCSTCWKDITPIFDGNFYDYALATCPTGHRQAIND